MYYSNKPANIIATNSMFILDEYADLKSIQVGGTLDWDSNYDMPSWDKHCTYLYLKGVDNNNEIAYLKIAIRPWQKAILMPQTSSIYVDKNEKIIDKIVDYYVYLVPMNAPNFYDGNNDLENSYIGSYYAYLNDEGEVRYNNVEQLLESIKLWNRYDLSLCELVKKPELHRLLCEYKLEE